MEVLVGAFNQENDLSRGLLCDGDNIADGSFTALMLTVFSVCYADFAVYTILDLVRLVEPGVVSEHAALAAWMGRVEQLPGVKQYLDTRPVCTGIGVAPKLQPKE